MAIHKISRIFLAALIAALFLTTAAIAQSVGDTEVNIYFFWGDGCPHCEDEKDFLDELINRNPNINVVDYEVWYDKDNQKVLMEFGQALGFKPAAVPVTVIGERYWIGFTEALGQEMEAAAKELLEDPNHTDIGMRLNGSPSEPAPTGDPSRTITLPIFGTVNLEQQSLVISTAIIGFVDGFNPCSLWVLSVLLAITLHSGSRKKILVVGITFLVVTTIVYSLFISGVFTLFSYVGYLRWIQILVALVALVFGIVNIKDYFWYKQGISFTISDKKKPKLYENMRSTVTDTRSMLGLIGSSAALAVGVSFVEFSCTAGFPVIWSNLVASSNVSLGTYLMLLGLYMLIYLLDELAVFGTIAVSMRASRVEEKHGRLLKLVSGVIMLTLGVVMVVNPELMNNVSSSLLVFLFALALTLVISIVHRRLLPALGIQIGDEGKKKKSRKRH
jgi:cytochrome c biogenesis protein CcdA/glutaredoxin